MKLRQRDYGSLSRVSRKQFRLLCSLLFPSLIISSPNNKGMLTIREKKFSIKRRVVVSHILNLLIEGIPAALSIRFKGNQEFVDCYQEDMKTILSGEGSELDKVDMLISFLYNECYDPTPNKVVHISNQTNFTDSGAVKEDEVIEIKQEPLNILEFLLKDILVIRKSKIISPKKYLLSFFLSAAILVNYLTNALQSDKAVVLLHNLGMRDPPLLHTILYNSS